MIQPAKRLETVQEYYFSKKLREVRELAAAGKPIINMGIGSPDLQPPAKVINAIQNSFKNHPILKRVFTYIIIISIFIFGQFNSNYEFIYFQF